MWTPKGTSRASMPIAVIRPTIIATTMTTVTRPRPPSASISMATRRLRESKVVDVTHPDGVDRKVVTGHRPDAADLSAHRRVDAVVVPRREVDDEADATEETPRLVGVSGELVDRVAPSLDEERAPLFDAGHRLDPPIGGAEHGAGVPVDRPHPVAKLAGEECVEARPASGLASVDALVEGNVVDSGIEPYNGAPDGRGHAESARRPIAWPIRCRGRTRRIWAVA